MSFFFWICNEFFKRSFIEISEIPIRLLVDHRVHRTSDVYYEVHRPMDCLREKEGERYSNLFLVFQLNRGIGCPLLCHTSYGSGFYPGLFAWKFYLFQKPLFDLQKEKIRYSSSQINMPVCPACRRQATGSKDFMDQKKVRRIPIFIGVLLLLIFARPTLPGIVVGILLIILGESIRIWAAGHLHKNEILTVSGPYAYVKNPLYIGTILITTGFCILANNIYLLAASTFMFCFHYIPYKKRVEGDRLRKIFVSQFEDYDQNVPDYIPRRTPYSSQKNPWRFGSFIENSEEGILMIVVAGILLILSRPYGGYIF